MIRRDRVESRQAATARTTRPPAETATIPGDLVLVTEVDSTIHRSSNKSKLEHEQSTGQWKVGWILQRGLSVEPEMEGRKKRPLTGTHKLDQAIVCETTRLAPPHGRQVYPVHLGCGFWPFRVVDSCHTPVHAGISKKIHLGFWRDGVGILGRYRDGSELGLLSESEVSYGSTPPQLDAFHA